MAFDEDVPLAANQIAVDIVAMNANWEYVISGDGTAGRVLRDSYLKVEDGTNANTLKCTLVSRWNGDAIAETDNIAKGATTGNFTLHASGYQLTIEAAGLSGNAVAVLSCSPHANTSTVVLDPDGTVTSNDIIITFYGATDGSLLDATVLVDTGSFRIRLTYLTDA